MRTLCLLLVLAPLALLACGDTGLGGGDPVNRKPCGGRNPLVCAATEICVVDPAVLCDPARVDDCPGICTARQTQVRCEELTDLASCSARSDCAAQTCPLCDETPSFAGCYGKDQIPEVACPAIACAACGAHGDQATCDADPSCHPVYQDPGTCPCAAPGCCQAYHHCAERAPYCTASPGGDELPCPPTFGCAPGFVYSYRFGEACPEGCVPAFECAEGG